MPKSEEISMLIQKSSGERTLSKKINSHLNPNPH